MAKLNADETGRSDGVEHLDALVIGAGVSGLYQLHCLLEQGFDARIYEAGEGVGGTWYWNHYPGAVLDSESWSYGYSFSEELLQEWNWSAEFAGSRELERYYNYVTDKFGLREHIRFGERVKSATFDETANRWDIETESGRRARTQFLITAVGVLSATHLPDIPGRDSFEGESFHSARWPREGVDFTGKRVGVIGTGSTGVQIIPIVAKECEHLTVFQRTPNYCMPLRNAPIDEERMRQIKADYPAMFKKCQQTLTGFHHLPHPQATFDVTPEEREAFYEEVWTRPGFEKWFGNFKDLMVNREANECFAEFVREKIRERVHDPELAEKLCPYYHFGAKRPPLETNYYEAYNRDNVLLVDLREAPIECITPAGVKTSEAEYELDVIIFATGFDAVTGEVERMDIRGVGGRSLKEKWKNGPVAYMGIQPAGFPNLFLGGGSVFSNFPRCAEVTGAFVTGCLRYMRDKGFERIEASREAEDEWCAHAQELTKKMLRSEDVGSWFFGSNIPGKPDNFLFYAGGVPLYREKCEEVTSRDFDTFEFE
jgi:cation diffusion facilitator CzcD-associated flavoprotein CzcO